MSMLCRFSILLPCKDNEKHPIDEALYHSVRLELLGMFGGYIWHKAPIDGAAIGYQPEEYFVVEVDVPSGARFHIFFRIYQELLECRFGQDCIWIVPLGRWTRMQQWFVWLFMNIFLRLKRKQQGRPNRAAL